MNEIKEHKENKGREAIVEYNDKGLYRIVIVNETTGETFAAGQWTVYMGVAKLTFEGRKLYAFSAYYDGALPIETVLEIKEVTNI